MVEKMECPEGERKQIVWERFQEDSVVDPEEVKGGIFGENDGATFDKLMMKGGDVGVRRGGEEP